MDDTSLRKSTSPVVFSCPALFSFPMQPSSQLCVAIIKQHFGDIPSKVSLFLLNQHTNCNTFGRLLTPCSCPGLRLCSRSNRKRLDEPPPRHALSAALCFSSQSVAVFYLAKRFNIVSMHLRASAASDGGREKLGECRCYSLTGMQLQCSHTFAPLRAMGQHRQRHAAAAHDAQLHMLPAALVRDDFINTSSLPNLRPRRHCCHQPAAGSEAASFPAVLNCNNFTAPELQRPRSRCPG